MIHPAAFPCTAVGVWSSAVLRVVGPWAGQGWPLCILLLCHIWGQVPRHGREMHNLCIDALSSLLSAIGVLWVLTPPPQIHINKRIGLALAVCTATESFLLYTALNFFLPLCSPLKTVFVLLFPIPLGSRGKLVPYLEAVGPQGQPLPPAGTWLPAWGVSFKSLKIRCVNNCSLVKERFVVQSWGGEGSSKETPFTCIMISCSGISLCNSCPLPLSDYILRMWYPARRALTASLQAKWTEKKKEAL